MQSIHTLPDHLLIPNHDHMHPLLSGEESCPAPDQPGLDPDTPGVTPGSQQGMSFSLPETTLRVCPLYMFDAYVQAETLVTYMKLPQETTIIIKHNHTHLSSPTHPPSPTHTHPPPTPTQGMERPPAVTTVLVLLWVV